MTAHIPKKIGKFEVIEVLGRGGMGIVYRGTDPSIGRPVAIKMTLGYANSPELLKRFYREAQSAGKLQHPNIVTIYDLGDQDGNPYMVMEYIEGKSLESIIAARATLPLEQKLNIAIQLCDALSYAHQHNVIHRDIKPANVMVLKDFSIKIVDFGIARIGNENVTRPGQLMGSVPYMSPEQIKDKAYVDSRTDIFSTGIVLYQLLTYALPFDGEDMGAILLKIIHEAPPPLNTYLSSYPPDLDRILATALAKNVEQRYPTAERLGFDLLRLQDELKREKTSGYLGVIESLFANSEWGAAREQILQLLRIDRQNPRGNELLSLVERQLLLQKRSEQAQQLRTQASHALSRNEIGDALNYLDRAVDLDGSNQDLIAFRNSVAEQKARADQVFTLLHRAESARETGEFELAQKAVDEALALDGHNREALGLKALLARDLEEQNKQRKVQNYVDEARKRIASRSFTGALQLLKQAEALSPQAPGVKELLKLALSGQEQEIRRKRLESLNAEIQDALNRDDFAAACAKADAGLQAFPEDRSLLKLKKLAEKQRQASEKRTYVEERIASARQALDSPEPQHALSILQQGLKEYPQEPALLSMLSVVNESLMRHEEEQKKAESVQQAKEAIRRRCYDEAIEILQATRKQIKLIDVDELDELVQFAQEEAANYVTRQQINETAEQANRFISTGEYKKAIDLLESALGNLADDELHIILEDARRRLHEFNELLRETISTAQRLRLQDRYAEVVKFLEAQSEQCGSSPEFRALLEGARQDFTRVQSFSNVKEAVREALSKEDFAAATMALQGFQQQYGDIEGTLLLRGEIEAARTRTAAAAMEKALSDVRMLLMVRSFDSAENIIENVSQWQPYAPADMQHQYEALRSAIGKAKAKRQAHEQREKLEQARVSNDVTASLVDDDEQIAATQGMSLSRLHTILGEITRIEEHYSDNDKLQSAIGDLRRRLTLRIDALEQIVATSPDASSVTQMSDSAALPSEAPLSDAPVSATAIPDSGLLAGSEVVETEPVATSTEAGGDRAREQDIVATVRTLLSGQDFQEALRVVETALKERPGSTSLQQARESVWTAKRRADALAEAEKLRAAGEFTAALNLLNEAFAQEDSELESLRSKIEADQRNARQEAVKATLDESRQLLAAGQVARAVERLRVCVAQYPNENEVSALLQSAEEKLQAEQEFIAVQTRIESLLNKGKGEEAIELVKSNLKKAPAFKALLANTRQAVADRNRQELLNDATQLQSKGHYREAQETVQRAIWLYGSAPAAVELERGLQLQIQEEEHKKARNADRERLSEIERRISKTKPSDLNTLLAKVQEITSLYPADDEIASIASRTSSRIEWAMSIAATPQPLSEPAQSVRTSPRKADQVSSAARALTVLQSKLNKYPYWKPAAALVLLFVFALGLALYIFKSRPPRNASGPATQTPVQQHIDLVEAKQRSAIDAAEKLFAAGDLAGARQVLQAVATTNGALSSMVQQKLNTIDAAMRSEASKQTEQQLWRDAMKQLDQNNFDIARYDLRKILRESGNAERQAAAQHYLDQVIPEREKEERAFAEAQLASRATDIESLKHANELLAGVATAGGPRKAEAEKLRALNRIKIQRLTDTQRQITDLNTEIESHIRNADFTLARQRLERLRQLGGDTALLSAQIEQGENSQRAQANQAASRRTPGGSPRNSGAEPQPASPIASPPRPTKPIVDQPATKESSPDEQDWTSVKNSDKPEELLAFAAKYPKSSYADRAREKAQQLTLNADRNAILMTLNRYKAAYENRSISELEAVWPNIPKKDHKQLADSFKQARAIRMDIHETAPPSVQGDAASVVLDRKLEFTFPEGVQSPQNQITIQLRRKGSSWVIEGIS